MVAGKLFHPSLNATEAWNEAGIKMARDGWEDVYGD